MNTEIATLLENLKADYRRWSGLVNSPNEAMIERFENGLEVVEGNKYTKIIQNNCVWGFVVAVDNDKKFRKGDILKPAGWAGPARNFARGNILDGGYTVRWAGL
jgi:hypothetical protein